MSDKAHQIAEFLAPAVQALGLELLGVEYLPAPGGATLRLYIDVASHLWDTDIVGIEDCERVSREVSAQLDIEDPITANYTLEVSSPGVDRPLFTLAHYIRHQGEMVKASLKLPQQGRRRLQGKIIAVNTEQQQVSIELSDATVSSSKSKKAEKTLPTLFEVAFSNIDKARLIPDWEALGLIPVKPGKGPKTPKAPKADLTGETSSNKPAAAKPHAE